MFTGYPFCDSECPSVVISFATCSAGLCLLSFMLLIMYTTPLTFWIQFVLLLSLRVTLTMIFAIFLGVVISFLSWVLLSDQVPQPCHYWEYTFVKYFPLQSHWHILSCMMLSSLWNALYTCLILIFISCTRSLSLVTIFSRQMYLSTSWLVEAQCTNHPLWKNIQQATYT